MRFYKNVILLGLTFVTSLTFGQFKDNVDQVEMITEIQKWEKDSSKMTLSFWIPNSYWRIALAGNPIGTEKTIKTIEDIFEDYVIVCAADILIDGTAAITSTPDSILRNNIRVIDRKGKKYYALAEADLSSELALMLINIKPMFAKMFGQMGSGMYFYAFEVKDKKGNNLIDETKEGEFVVAHSNTIFKWRLPLVSLLENKICLEDNEEMKGNWKFCPFHGVELK